QASHDINHKAPVFQRQRSSATPWEQLLEYFVVHYRVLTTSARKPPLRTDKFAALWRIAAPVHPIRRSNCAESGYCELIRPRKGLTSNNEAGQRAETAWSKRQKRNLCLKTRRS